MRDGSPAPSRKTNSMASARNATSGTSTSMRRRHAPASFSTALLSINSPLLRITALRATRNALRFEVVQHAEQMSAIEQDPRDQSSNDCDRGGIGSHDEGGMRTEVHHDGP